MTLGADRMGSLFWDEKFWLPANTTWKELETPDNQESDFGRFGDLSYTFPLALVIICIRYLLERILFAPIGKLLGLKHNKTRTLVTNDVLEEVYIKGKKLTKTEMENVVRSLGVNWSERKIQRWLRRRSQSGRLSKLDKFSETAFRWSYYLPMWLYGLSTLLKKPWFYDVTECWVNYPHHTMDRDVWWYYMIQLSFYISLSFSQFVDAKRKDFWQMLVHHFATIFLLVLSWTSHFTRVGTLVLLLHDCIDPWLETAKLAKYLKMQKLCDSLFFGFAVTWITTRLIIFPGWILYSTTFEYQQVLPMFPAFYIFNGLLYILQALHILWTYFLFVVIHRIITEGQVNDERSDSNASSSD